MRQTGVWADLTPKQAVLPHDHPESESRDRIAKMKMVQAGIMFCNATPGCNEVQRVCEWPVVCLVAEDHVWVHGLGAVRCCIDIHGQCYH